jgi:hypothetical protein
MIPSLAKAESRVDIFLHLRSLAIRLRELKKSRQILSFLVIAGSFVFSLVYTWFLCPLDLSSDEAHYWDWSRQLEWSYYSKGPLVALLIRLSCELFGSASIANTGDLGAAVRLPAALCHAALLAGSYYLAKGLGSPRLGLAVILAEVSLPLVRVGAVLMTIDPPFLACWCWALFCVWKALKLNQENRSNTWWWLGAAVFTALGTLTKYTMALLPLAVVGFILFHRRTEFRRRGIWILLLGAALGWIPIVAWNSAHDWASFRHVFGQISGEQGPAFSLKWLGPLNFLGAQTGMLFGPWLAAFLIAGWRFQPRREGDPGRQLVWWCSVPVWLLFALASFVKSGQPNWPAPAYVGGIILSVAWIREALAGRYQRHVKRFLIGTVTACLLAGIVIHFPGLTRPVLVRCIPASCETKPLPVRNLDISARLLGWRNLAQEVDRIRNQVRETTGEEPVLAGVQWTIPGHLRLYCEGQPDAYAIGIPNQSDRHSQYDYWRPNPIKDAQAFVGRTFVIVGELALPVRSAFDRIEPPIRVVYSEGGIPIAAWDIQVCHGFRGFAATKAQGW